MFCPHIFCLSPQAIHEALPVQVTNPEPVTAATTATAGHLTTTNNVCVSTLWQDVKPAMHSELNQIPTAQGYSYAPSTQTLSAAAAAAQWHPYPFVTSAMTSQHVTSVPWQHTPLPRPPPTTSVTWYYHPHFWMVPKQELGVLFIISSMRCDKNHFRCKSTEHQWETLYILRPELWLALNFRSSPNQSLHCLKITFALLKNNPLCYQFIALKFKLISSSFHCRQQHIQTTVSCKTKNVFRSEVNFCRVGLQGKTLTWENLRCVWILPTHQRMFVAQISRIFICTEVCVRSSRWWLQLSRFVLVLFCTFYRRKLLF